MTSANEYTELIAGAHVGKRKYTEWVFVLTEALRVARERLSALRSDFDVDTAIGVQLDAVGARVGMSRTLPMKLTGVYFALDDFDGVGLDRGIWKGRFDPEDGTTELGDETYRAAIRAKILSNSWNGTNETLPTLLETVLSYFGMETKVMELQDAQTMHVALHLTREKTPPIVWELITRRIIDVTAAGVGFSVVDNVPWFGLDYDTNSVKGLDVGNWFPFEKILRPQAEY